jgi:hypothetical protein
MDKLRNLWIRFLTLKLWQKVFVVFIAYVLISTVSGLGNSKPDPLTIAEQTQKASDALADKYKVEPAWYPEGYQEFSSNLAWRWGTSKETTCSYSSGSCWSVMVIAKSGCSSSLYGEIKIFDSSDVQIDYTNDSTSSVSPMQKVKLTFDTFNDEAQTAQISELRCY